MTELNILRLRFELEYDRSFRIPSSKQRFQSDIKESLWNFNHFHSYNDNALCLDL